jgi:hypothetical protein
MLKKTRKTGEKKPKNAANTTKNAYFCVFLNCVQKKKKNRVLFRANSDENLKMREKNDQKMLKKHEKRVKNSEKCRKHHQKCVFLRVFFVFFRQHRGPLGGPRCAGPRGPALAPRRRERHGRARGGGARGGAARCVAGGGRHGGGGWVVFVPLDSSASGGHFDTKNSDFR